MFTVKTRTEQKGFQDESNYRGSTSLLQICEFAASFFFLSELLNMVSFFSVPENGPTVCRVFKDLKGMFLNSEDLLQKGGGED